jgi:hypothetical protein
VALEIGNELMIVPEIACLHAIVVTAAPVKTDVHPKKFADVVADHQ